MPPALVIGLDAGGTSTRAALISVAGERLGAGRAAGGNPTTHGAAVAAARLLDALRGALAATDPTLVRTGTIGLAGAGRLVSDPDGRAAFDQAWRAAGLRCPYTVVSDALAGYAAGTPQPYGTIVISGTGAIAAEIRGFRVARMADGHGWLLGDAGSGFWLGREAVRRTLADLDAGHEPDMLGGCVLTELLPAGRRIAPSRVVAETLVQAVTRRPPVDLAALAPVVLRAHESGDAVAREIVDEAARQLSASVARIRPPDAETPIVLGGGLLTAATPLSHAVRAELRQRWPAAPLRIAEDAAAGAAWLAARDLPDAADLVAVHRRLLHG